MERRAHDRRDRDVRKADRIGNLRNKKLMGCRERRLGSRRGAHRKARRTRKGVGVNKADCEDAYSSVVESLKIGTDLKRI